MPNDHVCFYHRLPETGPLINLLWMAELCAWGGLALTHISVKIKLDGERHLFYRFAVFLDESPNKLQWIWPQFQNKLIRLVIWDLWSWSFKNCQIYGAYLHACIFYIHIRVGLITYLIFDMLYVWQDRLYMETPGGGGWGAPSLTDNQQTPAVTCHTNHLTHGGSLVNYKRLQESAWCSVICLSECLQLFHIGILMATSC